MDRERLKLGIMQPYFFPYIGYFQLMNVVDKWVIFDDVQSIRHGWVTRNRVLSPNLEKEWHYFNVPTKKHPKEELIKNIRIEDGRDWKSNILGKLSYYKRIRAPYFKEVTSLVKDCISTDVNSLTDLNIFSLERVASYLNINFDYTVSSKSNFDYTEVEGAGDWALSISKQLNASVYINPIGGIDIFDIGKYKSEHIDIKFLKTNHIEYGQSKRQFVPRLSIIDVMMFNSIEDIKEMLSEYKLE